MARTLTIYRERYTVEDDGHGDSEAVETETLTDVHVIDGYHSESFHESPAREAVGILSREYLAYGADGGNWFGREEPSVIDYSTGEEERVTGHLDGFTSTEERAVIRMLGWLDARDAARLTEYLSAVRSHGI